MTNTEIILIVLFIIIEVLNFMNNKLKNKQIRQLNIEIDLWRDSYNLLKLKNK